MASLHHLPCVSDRVPEPDHSELGASAHELMSIGNRAADAYMRGDVDMTFQCFDEAHDLIAEFDSVAGYAELLAIAREVKRLLTEQKFRPDGSGAESKLLNAACAAISKVGA